MTSDARRRLAQTAAAVVLTSGCSEALAPMYRSSEMRSLGDFVVRVDSVRLPATVIGGDSLEVRLFGVVPGQPCFAWIIGGAYGARRVDITVWGRNAPPPPGDCLPLHSKVLRFRVGNADSAGEEVFHVIVHQPGGTTNDREVTVVGR